MQMPTKSLWARRLMLYFSLGAGVIVILHVVFSYFGFLHTDVDSARYMLSALVQSEAAIVALVVTLSLVAVQLAAQSYSARVIEVFRKTPDLWILMGIYGVAIFYGLGVLKLIENPLVGRLSNLEAHVSFAYYLGMFAFVALVPYIWNTLEMLKPSTVINMLAEKITNKSTIDAIVENQKKPNDKDPIQPIIDIVNNSIMKYDYETARVGLKAIGNSTVQILNGALNNDNKIKIVKHVLNHLDKIGERAVSIKDSYFTFEIINVLKKIGLVYVELKLDEVPFGIVFHFGKMGKVAAKRNLLDEICWLSDDLGEIGEAAAKYGLREMAVQTAICLGDIGKVAVEKKLIGAIPHVAASLRKVGTTGAYLEDVAKESIESLELILKDCPIDKKYEDPIRNVIESIGWIGRAVVENNSDYRLFDTIELLGGIGKKASEENLDAAASETAKSLQLIARASSNHQLKWNVIEAQSEIGKISANRGLNATTWETAMSIGNLGSDVSDDQKLKALEFLEEIGLLACKYGTALADASRQVIDSLFWIGKAVVRQNNEKIAIKAISHIENIGIACKQNDCKSVTRHAAWCFTELITIITINDKTIEESGQILKKLNQAIDNLNLA